MLLLADLAGTERPACFHMSGSSKSCLSGNWSNNEEMQRANVFLMPKLLTSMGKFNFSNFNVYVTLLDGTAAGVCPEALARRPSR